MPKEALKSFNNDQVLVVLHNYQLALCYQIFLSCTWLYMTKCLTLISNFNQLSRKEKDSNSAKLQWWLHIFKSSNILTIAGVSWFLSTVISLVDCLLDIIPRGKAFWNLTHEAHVNSPFHARNGLKFMCYSFICKKASLCCHTYPGALKKPSSSWLVHLCPHSWAKACWLTGQRITFPQSCKSWTPLSFAYGWWWVWNI